jgi:hypothetical protein
MTHRDLPKGATMGLIIPKNNLPRSLLQKGNESLVRLHSDLIQEYIHTMKRTAWWKKEHSFATIRMYTTFFYRCLGDRLYTRGVSELSLGDLFGLYRNSHGGSNKAIGKGTILEHCRRFVVLATILSGMGILEGGVNEGEIRTLFADLYESEINVGMKTTTTPAKSLDAEDVTKLYSSCVNHSEFVLLLLLLTTGIRVGGAVRLRVDGLLDAETGVVKTEGVTTEKGGLKHRFFLCPVLQYWARLHINASKLRYKTAPVYVFPSRYNTNEPCSVGHLQRTFRRLCQRAGVRGAMNIHRTRHTLAHALRLAGTPANHIQLLLGHSCSRTTDQYGSLQLHQLVERMQLPWDGVQQSFAARDKYVLLRALCPPKDYYLPWMTGGMDDNSVDDIVETVKPANNENKDRLTTISVQDMVALLSKLVKHKRRKLQP